MTWLRWRWWLMRWIQIATKITLYLELKNIMLALKNIIREYTV
jgi:hypothetical protein